MKGIILVVGLMVGQMAVGQTSDVKDTYVKVGDTIEAILYHDNGMIAQQGQYTLDNKLHGEWISYDAKGNTTAIAQYDHGIKVGTWFFFEGNTRREVVYQDSRIAQVNTWEMKESRVVTND